MNKKELTKSEKISLGKKEIAKRIREELKEFKGAKFSVTIERYAGGSSINVALVRSKIKIVKDFENISEDALNNCNSRGYTRDQIKRTQEEDYHQLNPHSLRNDYNPNVWCNGVFLTEEGHKLLQEVVRICDHYNYDDSDSQVDYFDVNFYLDINLGKWNKPFIQEE